MTIAELVKLQAHLALVATYYSESFPDEVLEMFASDLADLDFETVKEAIARLRRDPKITRFPRPAQIRAVLMPALTPEDQARDVAARIAANISRRGRNWEDGFRHSGRKCFTGKDGAAFPTWEAAAESLIGAHGIAVVNKIGGWDKVVDMFEENQHAQAQIRELARTVYVQAVAGTLEQTPALPEPMAPSRALLPQMKGIDR
jgi:hypothetical protein